MTKQTKHVTYEEFMARMPALLKELNSDEEALSFDIEIEGRTYKVELSAPERQPHDPEAVRAMLRRTAGAFASVDTEKLKQDLREMRIQDSKGRPA